MMDIALSSSEPAEILDAVLTYKEAGLTGTVSFSPLVPYDEIIGILTQMSPSFTKPSQFRFGCNSRLVPALLLCSHLTGVESLAMSMYQKTLKHLVLVDDDHLRFATDFVLTAQFLQAIHQYPNLPTTATLVYNLMKYVLSVRYSESSTVLSAMIQAVDAVHNSGSNQPIGMSTVSMDGDILTVFAGNVLGGPVNDVISVKCGLNDQVVFKPVQNGLFNGRITGSGQLGHVEYKCSVTTNANSTYLANSEHVGYFYRASSAKLDAVILRIDSGAANDVTQRRLADTSVKDSLSLTFTLMADGRDIRPQQAFVQFMGDNGLEITYLLDYLSSAQSYQFNLDMRDATAQFASHSGLYEMSVIVGDVQLESSIRHIICKVRFDFANEEPSRGRFAPKRLHHHTFREPHKQPPQTISLAFTIAALAPFLILLISWLSMGANIMILPSLTLLGFYIFFGAILCLYVLYWTSLNMFETLRCLGLLVLPTIFCGSRVLRHLAANRKVVN